MNYRELPAPQYIYCRDVLGITQMLRPFEAKSETKSETKSEIKSEAKSGSKEEVFYQQAVILSEELTVEAKLLLDKVLSAFGWSGVDRLIYENLGSSFRFGEAFVFGRHLEDDFKKKFSVGKALFAPSLKDLIQEPGLKKLLWKEMQDYMGRKK